jgi:hypothetical protein
MDVVLSAITFPAITKASQGKTGNHPSNKKRFHI